MVVRSSKLIRHELPLKCFVFWPLRATLERLFVENSVLHNSPSLFVLKCDVSGAENGYVPVNIYRTSKSII